MLLCSPPISALMFKLSISNSSRTSSHSNQKRQFVEFRTPSLQFDASSSRNRKVFAGVVSMRDRSKNRKPLQKGRNLSIEAIQTVQALKRACKNNSEQKVLHSNFRRLLKLDMIAVLRELLRQNECPLALMVFEDIQKEYWYKPQVSLYAEIISALGRNEMFDKVELLLVRLKKETSLDPDTLGFNALLESLVSFSMTGVAMECFYFMNSLECEPDRSTFRILINHLEAIGELSLSASMRQEAQTYYGESLEFLEEQVGVANC